MPEISLKEYFGKLNSLLSTNAADEVIHNSRHILESYPKNVTAYRLLGRALVLNGRWEEGRDALRRVLSVIPDDYAAHLGLSEANERMDRPDEAIWHLERAFEQRPNDKELIDGLRGLYRRHRNVENLKIQLTAAAVARQYLRSRSYAQAIDTLRTALARSKDRLDLKLLLAQVLWQQGSQEEAAEIAVEVLKVLPDCLEANRIMAQLWLSVDRPSDAQRYVNHIEAVDPYLAVELAQGSPPDDDVFRLNELDYVRSAQSEMASARPDWLREISTAPAPAAETGKEEKGDEWSGWASAMLNPKSSEAPPASKSVDKSTSERFSAMAEQSKPASSGSGLTDLFGKPEEADADELSALFGTHALAGEEDPMAWLHDAGIETAKPGEEEPSYESLFAEEDDSPLPIPNPNPMAWLQGSAADAEESDADEPAERILGDEDPFAWMQEDVGAPFEEEPAAVDEHDDSLDWLQDDHLLDEALGLESLRGNPSGDFDASFASPARADRPTPSSETVEPKAGSREPAPDETVPGPRRGLTAILNEANFDWANKQDDEKVVSDDEMDDWLNQFGVTEPRKAATDAPEWLTDLETPEPEPESSDEDDEWFQPDQVAPLTPLAAEVSSVELLRMSASDDEEEDSDWLAEFAPLDEAPTDEEFGWKPDMTSELAASPEAAVAGLPDWLTDLQNVQGMKQPEPEPAASVEDEEFAWTTDEALPDEATVSADAPDAARDMLDWLSASQPEAASEPAVSAVSADELDVAAGEMPDWLSELAPEPPASQSAPAAEPTAVLADAEFTWMTDDTLPDAETAPEAEPESVAGEMPDWLSDLAPEQPVSQPVPDAEPESVSADAEFTWMTDEALTAAPAAPAVIDAEFTWMMDEQPTDTVPGGESTPESGTDAEPEAAPGEMPDWLTEFAPTPPASQPEADAEPTTSPILADAEFTWMTDEPLASGQSEPAAELDSEPEAVAAEMPDWLSELAPEPSVSEPTPEAQPPLIDSEFTWMTDETLADAEGEPAVTDAEFTWMMDEQPGDAEPPPEAEGEAVAAETPDWLSQITPAPASETPRQTQAEPELAEDEFAWMTDDALANAETASVKPDSEPEAVAGEMPAWMSELAPEQDADSASSDADAEIGDETISADEEFAWLDVPQPEEEPAAAVAEESVPDNAEPEPVLATDADSSTDATADAQAEEPAAEFDEGEEIDENESELVAQEDEILETTPARNAPDWLNAMVPGLDVDYEAAEPAGEEDDFEESAADSREFAWVIELVEEESATPSRQGFMFSRSPAWLAPANSLANGSETGGKVDTDLPDWPSDDADVPEWLR